MSEHSNCPAQVAHEPSDRYCSVRHHAEHGRYLGRSRVAAWSTASGRDRSLQMLNAASCALTLHPLWGHHRAGDPHRDADWAPVSPKGELGFGHGSDIRMRHASCTEFLHRSTKPGLRPRRAKCRSAASNDQITSDNRSSRRYAVRTAAYQPVFIGSAITDRRVPVCLCFSVS